MAEAQTQPATPGTPGGRPVPAPDAQSAPYWEAAARHQLVVAKCSVCHEPTLPPDVTCPNCHSTEPNFTFEPVSGNGKIRTWTVVRRSFLQGFDLPFFLVDVELDDAPGLRMIARLLEPAETELKLGLPVKVAFEDLTPEFSVPAFKLEKAA